MPLIIGITGGIGCGKTYVCNLFQQLGVQVYNTDEQVKSDIIRRDGVREHVIAEFGEDSYLSDGSLNKDKFRELLFTDPNKRTKMNEIVSMELIDSIHDWVEGKTDPYVLVECAVLYENGLDDYMDGVIVVACSKQLRNERLLKRGLAQKDIDRIMAAQWQEKEKIKKADYVLINAGVIEYQVKELHKRLTDKGLHRQSLS